MRWKAIEWSSPDTKQNASFDTNLNFNMKLGWTQDVQ